MANQCVWIPNADNGKQSKLFTDLMSHMNSREDATMAWGLTKTDFFKTAFPDIAKDENGEPTYQALSDALNLDSILDDIKKDMNRAIDLGLVTSNGKPVVFDDAHVALGKASEFNEKASKKIAVVEKVDDGYVASVVDNTAMNVAEADMNTARRNLNMALLNLLQKKLGFNIEFSDDPAYNGVFDPLLAEKNATNLRTVIMIANGERGLEALPEEVCHLIIAGLKNHPLKQRLDKLFTEDVVKQVLGDKYDDYVKKYKDGNGILSERLRDEAEGQMLEKTLKGEKIRPVENQSGITTLLRRIWNAVKSLFSKNLSVTDIDNAFSNAQNAILPVKDLLESGEIDTVLDRDAVMEHEKLYALNDDINKLADIAQDTETKLSKQLYILKQLQNKHNTDDLRIRIKGIREAITNGHYSTACYMAMQAISNELTKLSKEMDKYAPLYDNSTDLPTILAEGDLVERMKLAIEAYEPVIQTMANLQELIRKGEIEMKPEWADPIIEMINGNKDEGRPGLYNMLSSLKENVNDMRFSVLKQFLSLYYGVNGQKPENIKETDKWKWESIDMVLSHAEKDISYWDTNLFSAGDSRNILINIVHNVVVRQQADRNMRIQHLCARMQAAEAKLHRAGYDNNFVVDTDKDGIATGYYKSERDFARYEKEREAYAASLDKMEDIDYYKKQELINKWEWSHTEPVQVGKPMADGKRRIEKMPKKALYGVKDWNKGWSKEQQEYYDSLLEMKAELDEFLPSCYQNLYMMPQVRKSTTQAFDKGGRGFFGTIWKKWKSRWSIVDDNMDYGKNLTIDDHNGNPTVLTDQNGRPIKRVPVYFVHKMDDMRDLSTDATRGMFNYICMAVNFDEMGKLSSVVRLLKDHVKTQYTVGKRRGGRKVMDAFNAIGRKYEKEAEVLGMESRTVQVLDSYIDRMFFNETKNEIGNFDISDKRSINGDTLFNLFMHLTSVSRMGFNVLSGITNATQGETQMVCEAMTNRFFNIKDMSWSKKEYNKLLLDYMGQFNSSDRHDKMYLLINTFNSSEDFFRDMMDKDFNKSPLKRVMGRGNVYFLNTMGEHYLHTAGMLSVLHHEKVKRLSDGKEMTLYEAIKPVQTKNGWKLELADDIEFLDKNRAFLQNSDLASKKGIIKKQDRDLLFKNLAVYINRINANMHGGYSEAERGNVNRYAAGRMLLQFRQWMFGMYNKNFSRRYYQASTNTVQEGAYIIAARQLRNFFTGTLHDLKNMSLKEALEKNRLSDDEKRNARFAWTQSAIYLFLYFLGRAAMGWKDKDDRATRLLAYQIKRLELETGALCPVNPAAFFGNIITLAQSPAAGVSTIKELVPLFDMFSAMDEISAGRYKGWNRAERALFRVTPIYNVQKVIDMKDYNYMFNIFS